MCVEKKDELQIKTCEFSVTMHAGAVGDKEFMFKVFNDASHVLIIFIVALKTVKNKFEFRRRATFFLRGQNFGKQNARKKFIGENKIVK